MEKKIHFRESINAQRYDNICSGAEKEADGNVNVALFKYSHVPGGGATMGAFQRLFNKRCGMTSYSLNISVDFSDAEWSLCFSKQITLIIWYSLREQFLAFPRQLKVEACFFIQIFGDTLKTLALVVASSIRITLNRESHSLVFAFDDFPAHALLMRDELSGSLV